MRKNLEIYRSKYNGEKKICFVAKADCYGYKVEICRYFDDLVDYFAVSSAGEFYKLKKYTKKPILILDPIYNEKTLKNLILSGAELTLSNYKCLEAILKARKNLTVGIKVHIAINTGMNRFGINQKSDLVKIMREIEILENIEVKGIFSHFYMPNSKENALFQLNKFKVFVSIAKEFNPNILVHISASTAAKKYDYGDMIRLGYGIFGDENYLPITLESKIIEIQKLAASQTAGYDGVFCAKKNSKIAIVAIGYGDGLLRSITKKGYVLIHGKMAKIVAICMDCMMVDVTNIKCKISDKVILIGKSKNKQISICDLASWCDTIGYEIIVRLADRIKRVYIGDNKCKLLPENIEQES